MMHHCCLCLIYTDLTNRYAHTVVSDFANVSSGITLVSIKMADRYM